MEYKDSRFLSFFKMKNEREDIDVIHAEIEKGVVFKGTNLWILICAILVASVGLNMNSTAVIIGAMLISPLMGPIIGMGYGLATYEFNLFRKALKNFLFALVVSLITSSLYFVISPVDTAHSELLARTSPTIYDVFIALFGGTAGMLAMSSKLKGNVIPGVAIATALMPPLCTAGYGLATLQMNFLFGALYLFTINTVFIGVSSMLVSQILKFPIRSIVDTGRSERLKRYVWLVLLLTAVPSIYFGYILVQNDKFSNHAHQFIQNNTVQENSYLINSKVNSTTKSINLIYSGFGVSDSVKRELKEQAVKYDLDSSKIIILSGTDVNYLSQEKQKMQTESDILNEKLTAASFALRQAQGKLDSIKLNDKKGKLLLEELREIYPQIVNCAYSVTFAHPDTVKAPIVIYTYKSPIYSSDRNKIVNWTKSRLKNEKAKVFFER